MRVYGVRICVFAFRVRFDLEFTPALNEKRLQPGLTQISKFDLGPS